MPTKYLPISEDEQKFSKLLEKILHDNEFAKQIQSHPETALKQAGYHITAEQAAEIKKAQLVQPGPEAALSLSFVRPVVNIITRGTRPAVSVATKGTRPVVSVAINSIIAVNAAKPQALNASEVAKHSE